MERDTKIVLGLTATGVAAALYFYFRSKKSPAGMLPQHILQTAKTDPLSSIDRVNLNGTNPGALGGGGGTAPSMAPSGSRYASELRPVTFSLPSGGGNLPSAPMPSNYVQTPAGIFTWSAGGSFSAGVISNMSNDKITVTTPRGLLTLSPNMTYNVTTGEIGL